MVDRRIEALSRVNADDLPRWMRRSRYMARLPRRILGLASPFLWRRNRQLPALREERLAAHDLAESAITCFDTS